MSDGLCQCDCGQLAPFKACGHANWRKCSICHQWDDPLNLYLSPSHAFHRRCNALAQQKIRDRKKLRNLPASSKCEEVFRMREDLLTVDKLIEYLQKISE